MGTRQERAPDKVLTTGMRQATALVLSLLLLGVGCSRPDTSYVPAPQTNAPAVPPSVEGGKASTGGENTTVTPILATALLVAAMPQTNSDLTADEAQETRNPVPLPDGTRAEYVSVFRAYHLKNDGDVKDINVTLTDTRGIPALYAFLDSYAERNSDTDYRRTTRIGDQDAWITYSLGPNGDADGTGSIVFLYHKRFLIQIDGSAGVSAEKLATFAERFNIDTLN